MSKFVRALVAAVVIVQAGAAMASAATVHRDTYPDPWTREPIAHFVWVGDLPPALDPCIGQCLSSVPQPDPLNLVVAQADEGVRIVSATPTLVPLGDGCTAPRVLYEVHCTGPGPLVSISVDGSPLADQVTVRAPETRVSAYEGADRIDIHNGFADNADCGPGRDTVVADPDDRLVACERVLTG